MSVADGIKYVISLGAIAPEYPGHLVPQNLIPPQQVLDGRVHD
jgi:uncharacterized membrane protein